jgi:hypothetical protein
MAHTDNSTSESSSLQRLVVSCLLGENSLSTLPCNSLKSTYQLQLHIHEKQQLKSKFLCNLILASFGETSEIRHAKRVVAGEHFPNFTQSIFVTEITEIWLCLAHVFENLESSRFDILHRCKRNPVYES